MKYPQLVSMPSAVSNWLEEQLEARGIDAVLYTRYILSLLHSDAVDVILSDEDLHFSHLKKEVRRSNSGRKRFRRSSDWWRHAQADAEQLKRSAAVECLMSASEQTFGIESLIDELCEKLKEIKSEVHTPNELTTTATSTNITTTITSKKLSGLQQVSPQELANRYYAAFPALNRNTTNSPTKLISFIPKWIPSPKKKLNNNNPYKKYNRQTNYEDKLHCCKIDLDTIKLTRNMSKQQRIGGYFNRNKKDIERNVAKIVDKTIDDWDVMLNHKKFSELHKEYYLTVKNNHIDNQNDEIANFNDEVAIEDLPVDIRDLLDDSPVQQDDTVEMMNITNVRDTGKRDFIQCGTNIISSIWSNDTYNYDNTYNSVIDNNDESLFNFKFNDNKINWSNNLEIINDNENNSICENERNFFFENYESSVNWSLVKNIENWSDNTSFFSDGNVIDQLSLSFMKLNHNKDTSPFNEVVPKLERSQSFSHSLNKLVKYSSVPVKKVDHYEDDLLTSIDSHFIPINDKIDNKQQGKYVDGTTFPISNNLETVIYKRSESGNMYLENDYSMSKKYGEYKLFETKNSNMNFNIKFIISQNDKACQTFNGNGDELIVEGQNQCKTGETIKYDFNNFMPYKCSCLNNEETKIVNKMDEFNSGPSHPVQSDSIISEVLWQQNQSCDKCNSNNVMWNADLKNFKCDPQWSSLKNIWNGGEISHMCTCNRNSNDKTESNLQQTKLREDVSQDGDELLSDLSSLQKIYMEELPTLEPNCDTVLSNNKEKKRRHSFNMDSRNMSSDNQWSFASRLEEDCLIQMSAIPTLRSVTL